MINERRSEGYDYSIFHFIYLAPASSAILHREAVVGFREKALLNLVTNKSIKIAKTFIGCSSVNDVPIHPLGIFNPFSYDIYLFFYLLVSIFFTSLLPWSSVQFQVVILDG